MQQELVRMVSERTGIPEDKARMAAETVVGYLKDKLPAGMSGQLDNLTEGGGGSTAGRMAENIGSRLTGRE